MSSDELTDLINQWAMMNHPSRELEEIVLDFGDGKKIVWLVPEYSEPPEGDWEGELHSVERAILKILRDAGSAKVTATQLKRDVTRGTKCKARTFFRYLARLKENGRIKDSGDSYVIVT